MSLTFVRFLSRVVDAWSSLEAPAAWPFLRSAKTSVGASCSALIGLVFLANGFDLAVTCAAADVSLGRTDETWLLARRPGFSFLNCSLKLTGAA